MEKVEGFVKNFADYFSDPIKFAILIGSILLITIIILILVISKSKRKKKNVDLNHKEELNIVNMNENVPNLVQTNEQEQQDALMSAPAIDGIDNTTPEIKGESLTENPALEVLESNDSGDSNNFFDSKEAEKENNGIVDAFDIKPEIEKTETFDNLVMNAPVLPEESNVTETLEVPKAEEVLNETMEMPKMANDVINEGITETKMCPECGFENQYSSKNCIMCGHELN